MSWSDTLKSILKIPSPSVPEYSLETKPIEELVHFEVKPVVQNIVIGLDYRLSTNFTYGMLIRTEHREFIDKNIEEGKQYIDKMAKLCNEVLEPIIVLIGEVPAITSCFRCLGLNTTIKASVNSQHMHAEAADQVFHKMSLKDVFNKIMVSNIPYSQLIFEFGSWIHIGVIDEVWHPGKKRQNFVASTVDGKTKYTTIDKSL